MTLRWKDINENHPDPDTGQPTVKINIRFGKTGAREVIAIDGVRDTLKPLKKMFPDRKPNDLVFVLPDGSQPADLGGPFEICLRECGLLYSKEEKKRVLKSVRHTYTTAMLTHFNMPLAKLAEQLGNSVGVIDAIYKHYQPKRAPAEMAGMSLYGAGQGSPAEKAEQLERDMKRYEILEESELAEWEAKYAVVHD